MKRILTILAQKWPEYLLEILVLIVGIYGAFALENWKQYTEDRDKEELLIKELHNEMTENLQRFERTQEDIQALLTGGEELIKLFPLTLSTFTTLELNQKFGTNFRAFRYNPSYDASQGTIKSIINSGDLELILNDELRRHIITWEDIYKDYKEEEIIAWENGYEIMDWMSENFPNPMHVTPEYESYDLRALQAKIGAKLDLYYYTVEGNDKKVLQGHIERMIYLTDSNN